MKPESRALGQALLDHHRLATKTNPPGKKILPSKYTIRYGVLCTQAGVSHVLPVVGNFLLEVAEWCEAYGYPPLNSLAVNDTGLPGDGYDEAGGFKIMNWPGDVEACIRCTSYPTKMP